MTITPKEKELAAVGISVAAGCKPCTDHHVKVARKARATDEEIKRAIAGALVVRRSSGVIIENYALSQIGQIGEAADFEGSVHTGTTDRVGALMSVGAALAVNCVVSLEKHLASAEVVGVSMADIEEIVKLAAFIKRKAASHVERLVSRPEEAK